MDKETKKPVFKRVLAWVGIIILVLLYLLTLIFAIIDFAGWQRYFFASVGATIIIPTILWINIFLYDRMMDRRKEGQEGNGEG